MHGGIHIFPLYREVHILKTV